MSITNISTPEAITILSHLSVTSYREDTVMVQCRDSEEHEHVAALGRQALANGYVKRVGTDIRPDEHGVLLEFRKPYIPGVS